MKKRLGFLPNLITILRFILTLLFAGMLAGGLIHGAMRMPAGVYVVYILICLSDFFDGAAARSLKAESAAGCILDVSADGLFIFSSLAIFNLFGVLPVWFTAVAAANFLVFLATSRFLARRRPEILRSPFVFDLAGRMAAVLFYLVPMAACAVYGRPSDKGLLALNALLYLSVFLAGVSMVGRCVSCFAGINTKKYGRRYPDEAS